MSFFGLIRLLSYSINGTKESKGRLGEKAASSIFTTAFFGKGERYIVNNVLFETANKSTHQIDHIVIYKTGIFCLETKNLRGSVIGTRESPTWRVQNYGVSYDIQNPIMQNKTHVRVLSEFLGNKYDIHSVVVLVRGNKPQEAGEEVLNLQELRDYIKNYPCEKELSSDEMKAIYARIVDYKDEGVVSEIEHIKYVKKIKEGEKEDPSEMKVYNPDEEW